MDFIPSDLPVENEYPKLVRDNIPQIVQDQRGVEVETKILESDNEYVKYLLKKMLEEAAELEHAEQKGNTKEELADIFEIIDALLKVKGLTTEDIRAVQKEKREKNGGFEKRI